jgi:hypothetical protein
LGLSDLGVIENVERFVLPSSGDGQGNGLRDIGHACRAIRMGEVNALAVRCQGKCRMDEDV